MSTIDLNHVVSMNNVSVMNSNFDIIEQAVNGDLIHVSGGQNVLKQDLDLDSNDLLNVGSLSAQSVSIGGTLVVPSQLQALNPSILAAAFSSPTPIGNVSPNTGVFTTLSSSSTTSLGNTQATSLNNTPVGNVTTSSGAFTSLAASGTVSGVGFINLFAAPYAIGSVTPAAGSFTSLSATGALTGFPGRLLSIQIFTSSGTYTPTTGAVKAVVEVLGGGGGGGGTTATGASQSSCAGGGGSGTYAKASFTSPVVTTVTVGAGGTAGTTAGVGGTGGTSSFGTLVSCPGGVGSPAAIAAATVGFGAPGVGGAAATISGATPIVNTPGQTGQVGYILAVGSASASGFGASSPYGAGAAGRSATNPGLTSTGYGSGGSGGNTSTASSAAQIGGAGAPGLVLVYEYS